MVGGGWDGRGRTGKASGALLLREGDEGTASHQQASTTSTTNIIFLTNLTSSLLSHSQQHTTITTHSQSQHTTYSILPTLHLNAAPPSQIIQLGALGTAIFGIKLRSILGGSRERRGRNGMDHHWIGWLVGWNGVEELWMGRRENTLLL